MRWSLNSRAIHMSDTPLPTLMVMPIEDASWYEVLHQQHPDGRVVCIRQKAIERSAERNMFWTLYEPGFVLRQHVHVSDQITHLVEGEFRSGDTLCKAPAVLVLKKGALFGPVVAGPKGALLLEIFIGSSDSSPTDMPGFQRLLEEKGIRQLPGLATGPK